MAKKRKEPVLEKKQKFSKKQIATITIIVTFIVSTVSVISLTLFNPQPVFFSMNAVIIDQLGLDSPNSTFVNTATLLLRNGGFNVSYISPRNVTVAFFRGLAKDNYGIIILRTHTAMREQGKTVDIFTSEAFSSSLYKQDQTANPPLLVEGKLNLNSTNEKDYFAVTSDFISSLEGEFPKSVVFMMGCWSLKADYEQVAKAFISRGAEICTGWSDTILSGDTDAETVRLVSAIIQENSTFNNAVLFHYYIYNGVRSELGYYPTTAGGLRLSDLLKETKSSADFEAIVPGKALKIKRG